MIPSLIKIESFTKRFHMGTLGGKGLMGISHNISFLRLMKSLIIFPFLMGIVPNIPILNEIIPNIPFLNSRHSKIQCSRIV